nr:copper chaperone CopZ [Lentibacillus kapialis]
MMEKTLNVQGMSCGHCKMSVEGALNELEGVSAAEVNLEAGKVGVTFDESKVNVDAMKEAVEDQGYDVSA